MTKLFKNRQVLSTCRIYQMLKKNGKKRHLSFHTPGHKIKGWDVTELSYSDNLSSPHGCIAQAQEDIARLLGAKKSFLLTDGSTSGVLAMLHAAKSLGVRTLLLSVQSHKSLFNGCALLGITPLVYEEKREGGIPVPCRLEELQQQFSPLLEAADGIFVTSPTYYGELANLAALRQYCNERSKLLLVDGAHGSHLHFDATVYAGAYADMWVDGVHKNLPALTQGAVVSAREGFEAALQASVEVFRTTSPSYPIMASIEYAVKYPRNLPLENAVRKFVADCPRVRFAPDWTKLCTFFGKHAFSAQEALEAKGIYPEFCDGNVLTFYLSPCTSLRALQTLKKALSQLFTRYPYEEEIDAQRNHAPLLSVENAKTEWIPLDEAEGRICAVNCGLFPPCTPLLLQGERIAKEKMDLLKKGNHVYGTTKDKILVVASRSTNDDKGEGL